MQTLRDIIASGRWQSFWTKPNADRGRERYRRASISATASLLAQGLAIVISLASVPLTVGYLGHERYGVWLTISSLLTWMAMSDFGLAGNALVSLVGEANGKDDRQLAREYVAAAFWCLVSITASVALAMGLAFFRIPWRSIFRVSEAVSTHELHLTCALAVASLVTVLPLNMLQSIYSGYQDGYVANIWATASNALQLVSLIVVSQFRGGLPLLILAISGTRLLVALVNGSYLFGWRYPWLLPTVSVVHWFRIRQLFSLGSKYMVSQLAGLGIYQSQPMIITQTLGPSQVAVFVVAQKVITLASNLIFTAVAPLIPAYSEAGARKDWAWIRAALKKSIVLSFGVGAVLTILAASVARPVIRVWAGPSVVPSSTLVLWLGVYSLVSLAVYSPGQVLVALGRMGTLAVSVALCALGTIGLSILFVRWWGLAGIACAMSLATLFVMGVTQFVEAYRLLNIHATQLPVTEEIAQAAHI